MKKIKMTNHFILGLVFLAFNWNCQSDGGGTEPTEEPAIEAGVSQIDYQVSQQVFTNPERGFMHTWTVFSEGNVVDPTALDNLKNQNVSLILRLYYLEQFKDGPLSTAQLELFQTDMERFREAGVKCVLRFAYTNDQNGTDAPIDVMETHLDQLAPLFEKNADVIAFVQAGFIGAWGEWYYSSNGLANTEGREALLTKMLEVFPENIKIQVRTPLYKQAIFGYSTAMGSDIGYGTSDLARVGFHNDCFMASTTDYGTYQDIAAEKDYISKEALYVPTGGETCPPVDIPLADCTTAETEMELLKWTYLNLDYYGPVLDGWRNANCFEDFQRRLGYRLALRRATLADEVSSSLELRLDMENLGFAPVYSTKNSYLVLRSTADGTLFKKPLELDIRRLLPDSTFEWEETLDISDVPQGSYELLLEIADAFESLQGRPEYSIRLANANVWEASTGFNDLNHTITIN
ncbi:MAG: hypothetical protein CMH47_00835 [Muricauda sp.]|nr:hypothetical protein [Allomuricauda sp.]|tara:strand:+ start:2719 stop:4104 length:1386 start_codon:yes stop_codon:yes gene_type:complete